jgi:hypothetical protein
MSENLLRPSAALAGSARRVTPAFLLTMSAISLALALQIDDGHLHPVAVVALAIALSCLVRACFGDPIAAVERAGSEAIDLGLGIAIVASMVAHMARFPITTFPTGWPIRVPVYVGLVAAALLVVKSFQQEWRWRESRLAIAISLFALMSVWIIVNAPAPDIDVYVVLHDSCAALLKGQNPYAITFPSIYGEGSPFYPAGAVSGGRLNIGFVYPPLLLLLALPGHLLGDVRYSHLAAMAITAAIIGVLRPDRRGFLIATLYLFSPRSLFVLERSWTEPFVTFALALVVLCACRARRWLPVALGLLFASKQYMVFAVPAIPLLWPKPFDRKRFALVIVQAGLVAALISLPLALWDLRAFWRSVFEFQARAPFRDDALSFPAALAYVTGWRAPCAIGFVAAVVALALAARRCPRTPSGFCAVLAATYFIFFAFNRQAFCNYYYFVFGIMCLAVATAPDLRAHGFAPSLKALRGAVPGVSA